MTFRLGVVGHKDTLDMVSELVKEYFDDVDVHGVEFGNDDKIAVLFCGSLSFRQGAMASLLSPGSLHAHSGRLHHTCRFAMWTSIVSFAHKPPKSNLPL